MSVSPSRFIPFGLSRDFVLQCNTCYPHNL